MYSQTGIAELRYFSSPASPHLPFTHALDAPLFSSLRTSQRQLLRHPRLVRCQPTIWWSQEPLVCCNACAALFWMEYAETVGIMPKMPRNISPLTRRWLRWRGGPDRRLQLHKDWSHAMRSWSHAQQIGTGNFEDVVYVLARSKGQPRPSSMVAESYMVGLERPLP
jgi:hypothetical protein